MKKITCLIADDEPMALNLIESYVLKTPFLELKAKCNSAIEAMQVLEEQKDIDLFFLDIPLGIALAVYLANFEMMYLHLLDR